MGNALSPLQPSVTPLRTVSAVDEDASQLPVWTIESAAWLSIGALCSIAGGLLVYRIILMDTAKNVTGCSPPITLQASSGPPDFGAQWIGTPSEYPAMTVCSTEMTIKVDQITGTWTINAQAFFT